METRYPVVDQRQLQQVPPKSMWRRGPHGREQVEIPRAQANHCLVYRTAGRLLQDEFALQLDSSTVIDADYVSMVDRSIKRPVTVTVTVPSQDANRFDVMTTFLCTVHDPITVVREGVTDARVALISYLRSHQRIFELGLEYRLNQVNKVRTMVSAQITAYVTVSPPEIPGMTAELASVEVATPKEIADYELARLTDDQKHQTDFDNLVREQELTRGRTRFTHISEVDDQAHRQGLDSERLGWMRREQDLTTRAIGTDPVRALAQAHVAGEINSRELTDALTRLRDQEREELENERAHDRRAMLDQIAHSRETQRLRAEAEREDTRAARETSREERAHSREIERLRLQAELECQRSDREGRREEIGHSRETERIRAQAEREDQIREFDAKAAVIRELIKDGHFSTKNLQAEQLLAALFKHPTGLPTAPEAPRLDSASGETEADDVEADDQHVREDDVY